MELNDRKRHFWKGALVGALTTLLVVGVAIFMFRGMKSQGMDERTEEKLNQLKSLVDQVYLYEDDVDEQEMQDGILAGYIDSLKDPYSVYYNEQETKDLYESTSGKYTGIGVVLTQNLETNIITATQIYDGPAKEAGILEGDIIYKINGEDITSLSVSEVAQRVKGEEHTTVEVTVLRGEDAKEITMEVERREIKVETISKEWREDNIGYIRITEFDTVTYNQFEDALEEFKKKGMEGLILDVRANPGGNLLTVAKILDLLLPEGTIVYTEDKDGNRETLTSDEKHQLDIPMVVLADGNSASAAEIFAGAIQDYEWGTIMGTTTYGKGIVQKIIDLDDDTCVKLTIAEYFTPKGRSIHKKGVEPDIEVKYVYDEENPEADNQLEAAEKEVKKLMEKER